MFYLDEVRCCAAASRPAHARCRPFSQLHSAVLHTPAVRRCWCFAPTPTPNTFASMSEGGEQRGAALVGSLGPPAGGGVSHAGGCAGSQRMIRPPTAGRDVKHAGSTSRVDLDNDNSSCFLGPPWLAKKEPRKKFQQFPPLHCGPNQTSKTRQCLLPVLPWWVLSPPLRCAQVPGSR
jgi:hypothetical protein